MTACYFVVIFFLSLFVDSHSGYTTSQAHYVDSGGVCGGQSGSGGGFSSEYFNFPLQSSFHQCSILICHYPHHSGWYSRPILVWDCSAKGLCPHLTPVIILDDQKSTGDPRLMTPTFMAIFSCEIAPKTPQFTSTAHILYSVRCRLLFFFFFFFKLLSVCKGIF
jgi:hypothetical protein